MIKEDIKAVLVALEEVKDIQEQAANGAIFDFKTEMEPFVNRLSAIADTYKTNGIAYIAQTPVKYMSEAQIVTAGDNLKRLAVSCFAPKVNETQYNRHLSAVTYTQERFLEGLELGDTL